LPPELALVQDSSLGAFDEVVAMLRGSGSSLDGDAAATAATGVPNDAAAAAAAAAAYSLKEQPFDFDKRDQIRWLGFTRYRRLATLHRSPQCWPPHTQTQMHGVPRRPAMRKRPCQNQGLDPAGPAAGAYYLSDLISIII
jgi:hypothetical protein